MKQNVSLTLCETLDSTKKEPLIYMNGFMFMAGRKRFIQVQK